MVRFFSRTSLVGLLTLLLMKTALVASAEKQPHCMHKAAPGQSDGRCEVPEEDTTNLLQTVASINHHHGIVTQVTGQADDKAKGQAIDQAPGQAHDKALGQAHGVVDDMVPSTSSTSSTDAGISKDPQVALLSERKINYME